jgi:hypothetical protein
MSRHVLPCIFWLGTALCGLALLLLGVRATAQTGPKVSPNLVGIALGFSLYQSDSSFPLETGVGRFAIDRNFNRRFIGGLALQSDGGWTLFNTINVTLPHDYGFVGTGEGLNGKFEMRGDLVGYEDGAVISTTELRFNPVSHRRASASILALRGFDLASDPPAFGTGQGTFQSIRNPLFHGLANLSMNSPDEPSLSFQGSLAMAASLDDQPVTLEFDQFGTIRAADGRFVMIGQGGATRLTAEGVISSSPARGTFADALYRVLLQDGTIDYGAFNFSLPSPSS